VAVVAGAALSILGGCSDVGDNFAIPPQGMPDASVEAAPGGAETGSPGDGPLTEAQSPDATRDGTAGGDATLDATPGEDGKSSEAGGEPEASTTPDTGTKDAPGDGAEADGTGPADAPADIEETGIADSGTDAGIDGSVAESGSDAGADGGAEAGAEAGEDAPADVGPEAADAGPTLVPCTTAGQTGCVQCQHSPTRNGVCTPTEAALVQHDIDIHVATAPGADPADGCYTCLDSKLALDDDRGNTGNECEDSIPIGTTAECEAVLSCILHSGNGTAGSSCAATVVDNCYCGPAAPGSTCQTAGSGVNGVCASQSAAGLGFPLSDNADILRHFTDQMWATGVATTFFQYAITNHCPNCLN
jgi:hypothetical protein